MQAASARARLVRGVAVAALLVAPAGTCLAQTYTETCVHTPPPVWPPPHTTCVAWTQGAAPIEGQNFDVDYDCAGCYLKPNVEFTTGDDTWHVYALDTSGTFLATPAADLGEVTVDPGQAQNYTVAIAKPGSTTAAAVNVTSANLTPLSGQYTSLATGSRISGDFLGNALGVAINVVESGGSGGELNLIVSGDVNGGITVDTITNLDIGGDLIGSTITATTVEYLTIGGTLGSSSFLDIGTVNQHLHLQGPVDGNITIGTLEFNGDLNLRELQVGGPVAGTSTIEIAAFNGGEVEFLANGDPEINFAGKLSLPDGGATGAVYFYDTFDGVIDVTGPDDAPTNFDIVLRLDSGGSGTITCDGALSNNLYLTGKGCSILPPDPDWCAEQGPFDGTATFGCDEAACVLDPECSAALCEQPTHTGSIHFEDCELQDPCPAPPAPCLCQNPTGLGANGSITYHGDLDHHIQIPSPPQGAPNATTAGTITVNGSLVDGGVANYIAAFGGIVDGGSVIVTGNMHSAASIIVGTPVYPANLAGNIEIGGDLEGAVLIAGAASGDITVGGQVDGTVQLARHESNRFSGTGTFGSVGSLGLVRTGGGVARSGANDLNGTIDVMGDMNGTILVDGSLATSGSKYGTIQIGGSCGGPITIYDETAAGTSIDIASNVYSGCDITINDGGGDFNANGDLVMGLDVEPPMGSIGVVGSIHVKESAGETHGHLVGDIWIYGCHRKRARRTDICVDGNTTGDIEIVQTDCPYPLCGYACGGGTCP